MGLDLDFFCRSEPNSAKSGSNGGGGRVRVRVGVGYVMLPGHPLGFSRVETWHCQEAVCF